MRTILSTTSKACVTKWACQVGRRVRVHLGSQAVTRTGKSGERANLQMAKLVLAPQSGYLSNFCHPVGPLIEPMVAHRFQSDP